MNEIFDRLTSAVGTHQEPPTTGLDRVPFVAFAGLAVALGCPPDRVGELYKLMWRRELPSSVQAAVDEFREEIAKLSPRP